MLRRYWLSLCLTLVSFVALMRPVHADPNKDLAQRYLNALRNYINHCVEVMPENPFSYFFDMYLDSNHDGLLTWAEFIAFVEAMNDDDNITNALKMLLDLLDIEIDQPGMESDELRELLNLILDHPDKFLKHANDESARQTLLEMLAELARLFSKSLVIEAVPSAPGANGAYPML